MILRNVGNGLVMDTTSYPFRPVIVNRTSYLTGCYAKSLDGLLALEYDPAVRH